MKKIFMTIVLSVSGTLIGYSVYIGDAPEKIPCKRVNLIVDCYEEQ